MLMWINLPYACFGAVFSDRTGTCTEVAPIGRWMRGKAHVEIERWVRAKGGVVERLP